MESSRTKSRASFDAALQQYRKLTGYDILSGNAASAAGIAPEASPNDIHIFFKTMLDKIRCSEDGRLDTVLGRVLEILLLFNEICGDVAAATQILGGRGLFIAFGIFLKTLKNYQDRKGQLATLLTKAADFLERFAVRERLDINDTWNHELYERIFVTVLNVFALATRVTKGKIGRVLRGMGAACLSNKDISDALAQLETNVDAECRWTTIEVLAAVERAHESVSQGLSQGFDLSHAKLDFANSTLKTLAAIRYNNTPAPAPEPHTCTPNATLKSSTSSTFVLRSRTSELKLRLTSTQATTDICIPLLCLVVLTLVMFTNFSIPFGIALANLFMWHQASNHHTSESYAHCTRSSHGRQG